MSSSDVPQRTARQPQEPAAAEELRRRHLPPAWKAVFCALTALALLIAVNQLFNLRLPAGQVLLDNQYLYLLGGIFLACSFLGFPASPRAAARMVPWYDAVLCLATLAVSGYFAATGQQSLAEGWEYGAPPTAVVLSFVYWALIVEAARRTGGWTIFAVIMAFSLYPTFADRLPGPVSGFAQSLPDTMAYHMISSESSFGIPMRAFGELVIGFIVFGAVLGGTGAGRFFNDLAFSLVGAYRGGAAKVAIFASGLMGSMSGSVVSNVLTTGVVSIPAMRRTGFSARYAAGVEACASTGGVLMPPVMGTTAFVMASFLGIPYTEVAIAAAIPSLLYYFGLFVQIDAHAARRGLVGLPRQELPRAGRVLRDGWYYTVVFAVLLGFMLLTRQETLAPFYATAVLLAVNQLIRRTRLDWRGAVDLLAGIGFSLAELVAVLAGVGLIVGAFSATGLAGTLANDLVFLAGDAVLVLLVMGAVTSFVFGMGMTVTACYIFLAIVLAPALTRAGFDPLAVHLFILYWGMVSFITPPVALGAFAAATLARASPIAVGLESMRLGSIIYFVPFFFVLNPALILHGPAWEIAVVLLTAVAGIVCLCAALQNYLAGVGELGRGRWGWLLRVLLFAAGLALMAPGNETIGIGHWTLTGIGLLCAVPALLHARLRRGGKSARPRRIKDDEPKEETP